MTKKPPLKICPKCKRKLPATPEYFHRHKGRKDGLHALCISCKRQGEKERNHQWYLVNRERVLAETKKRTQANPEAQRERHRKWYQSHKELSAERVKANNHAVRLQAIEHYGGKCQCCGETQLEFLALDHINGGGSKHRKEIPGGHLARWVRKHGYPPGYQVLCHNCNMAKALYGRCPHQA